MRGAVLLLALVCAAVAVSPAAAARTEALRFSGCVSESGKGCAPLPAGSLTGASAIAVSPDGRSVYVSSYGADTVTAFGRAEHGRLRFLGCVANAGARGCTAPPGTPLRGPSGLAVSQGGGEVSVVSGLSRSVTTLSRGSDGRLSFEACSADVESPGCARVGRAGTLAGATGIAVDRGGSDVYVAAVDSAAVTHLRRRADGSLALADCVSGGPLSGCRKTAGNVFAGADALALAPDGRDLYVASYASNAVVRLRIGRRGRLRFAGCIADDGANFCEKLPHGTLAGAAGIAVSPDGRDLYVAAQSGTVTRLRPRPRRGLAFGGCLADPGVSAPGCERTKQPVLAQATGIAVSPNGRDLYVAAPKAGTIVQLQPGRRGSLRFARCVAPRGAHRCGRAPAPALSGAYALALAPDGRDLFVAAARGAALAAFARR